MKHIEKIKNFIFPGLLHGCSGIIPERFFVLKPAKKCSDGSETVFQAFPGDISSTKLMVPRNFRNSINFEGMDLRAQEEL